MNTELRTQEEYKTLLFESIEENEKLVMEFPTIGLYKSVLNQLLYIKKIIITEKKVPTEELAEPLTLGSLAVKNFDYDEDIDAKKLMALYGYFILYNKLS